MDLQLCELLEIGAIQEIRAGRDYIHSLFHLDQPSVTIVVRTDQSPLSLPQFDYRKPSLAIDPFFEHSTTTKKMQCITAMFGARREETDEVVGRLLEETDFQTSVKILTTLHGHLGGSTIDKMFGLSQPAERFQKFLDIVRRQHGKLAETLPAVFAHRQRTSELVRRRSYITDPEHRFFFALLLNADDRETVFSLIGQRYPDIDPIEKVLDWIDDLSRTRLAGSAAGSNALGIADFDELDLSLVENLLKGKNDEEIQEILTQDYGAERLAAREFESKLNRIRASVIFQPLLN
ncbi:MAG: hypothetical protein LC734_07220, partial [Acidobacteria bacterium]|nr:hypothetical protein [Acidobacteriota bacterium]